VVEIISQHFASEFQDFMEKKAANRFAIPRSLKIYKKKVKYQDKKYEI